jgi:hypothetical protein
MRSAFDLHREASLFSSQLRRLRYSACQEDYPAHYKYCTAEEMEAKKADAYVTWRDTFKHEMLTYDYCVTKEEIERINGEVRLSVVLTDLEGVAQIKATKVRQPWP